MIDGSTFPCNFGNNASTFFLQILEALFGVHCEHTCIKKRERRRVLYLRREISRTFFDDTFRELSNSECSCLFCLQKEEFLRMIYVIGSTLERCRTRRTHMSLAPFCLLAFCCVASRHLCAGMMWKRFSGSIVLSFQKYFRRLWSTFLASVYTQLLVK